MTDRIDHAPRSVPTPGARPPAATAAAEVGAMTRDVLSLGGATAVEARPARGSALGRFFGGVGGWLRDLGVRVRAAVADAWNAVTTYLREHAPAGAYEPLALTSQTRFPRALAKEWRGQPALGASQPELAARAEALARLDPATRARFDALRARFGGSPRPQEALDALLASGKLLKADLVGGGSTLDHLEAIASRPLDPAIADRRDDFLGETLMELAEPASVCQRGRNTCGAASAQGWLAEVEPAEYARLAYGLATPAGRVRTARGDALARDPHWGIEEKPGEGHLRTNTSRLLQASLMDLASNGDYDNAVDRGRWSPALDWLAQHVPVTEGAWPHGVARLMASISGRDYRWLLGDDGPEAKGVFRSASRANPIPVLLNYTTEGEGQALHWIRLVGHDPATDVFTVRNAQRGTEDRIAGDEFRQRMLAVACRPEDMPGAR